MRTKSWFLVLALAAAAPLLRAEEGSFDKTIPFPRGGEIKLDWAYQKCEIHTLVIRDYPDKLEIEKARREDPNDHASITWEFQVDNRSSSKFEVKVVVEVLDKDGQVIKAADGKTGVGSHSADKVRVSTKMRTIEAADAPKVRLRGAIIPK
jgi:hypothetical protein